MFRSSSKWISMLLIFSLAFVSIAPATAIAQSPQTEDSSNVADSSKAYRAKNQDRILELEDKRDQHTKYFLNSDGSQTAETSIGSRHYKDNNGKWQDISSRLVQSGEPGFDLTNEANWFRTHFAKNTNANSLVKIKSEQSEIAWGLEGSNRVFAVNDTYNVIYADVLSSTDLQYQLFADGLKENIILKNTNAPNVFEFEYTFKGLEPITQEDGSIALKDAKTGDIKFSFDKPYMIDSNNQRSDDVSYSLEHTDNPNVYKLTVIADSVWLADSSRSYPVTLDPTVSTVNWYTSVSTGEDTYVASNSSYSYYNSTYMTTGYDAGLHTTRSLVKFPLPTLPSGAIVTDGVLSLYKYTTTSADYEDLRVRRVTSDWQPSVTWATRPTVDTSYTVTHDTITDVAGNYTGWINFNVWDVVKGWINGGLPNYGFEIDHFIENNPLFFYYTSEDPSGKGPFLSITYITDQTGLNPYWSYANTPIGSVNTFNGNFISSTSDFSLPGRGIPVDINRTYNSRGSLNGIFGQKWFANLDMQLQFFSWGAVFLDSAGTERPFMLKSGGAAYLAPDNYPMQLYKTTRDGATIYIIQEANLETGVYQDKLPSLIFDNTGKLIELTDGKGNSTKIVWSAGSITITDPSLRTVTLTRNADGTVKEITTSAEAGKIKAAYTYSGGNLTNITYDNGTYGTTSIGYGWSNGLLTSYTDQNGNKTYLSYNDSNQFISTGTANLLANPSLEASPDNVLTDNWAGTITNENGSIKQSTTEKKFGRRSLDIQSVYKSGTTGDSYMYVTQKVPAKPGQIYRLSSYIKTNQLGGSSIPNNTVAKAFLNVRELDANGNHIKWTDNRINGVSGTTDWTRSTFSLTTQANTAYIVVYLEVQHDLAHFGGDVYFDGVQLEESAALLAEPTDFEGHTDFRYGLDGSYKAAWITTPAGELVEYKNNNYGNPVSVITDPKDLTKYKAETQLTWDASDRLRSLTTPNQVDVSSGKKYVYEYDAVGNPVKATDPKTRITNMTYYYNQLSILTQADENKVQNLWDPVSLNNENAVNQTLNSRAYTYDTAGNVTRESNLIGVADNRILNGSFEELSGSQPVNWTAVNTAGSVNQVEYNATAPFGGSNVLHLNANANNNTHQITTDYIDSAGADYFTVSGYIKSSQFAQAALTVYWYDASKTLIGYKRNFNTRSSEWQRYTDTIMPPSTAVYAKVLAITYGPGDTYFDNIQFEKSKLARGYNYLETSSFEQDTLKWSPSNGYATVAEDGQAYSGTHEAKISNPAATTSYLQSTTVLPVKQGQSYTLAGYLKTYNISTASGTGAWLHIYFYDSTGAYVNDFVTKQVTGTTEWTKYSLPFESPTTGTAKVRVEIANASGTAYFDNIRLSPGRLAADSFYDSGKNYVTSSKDQYKNTVTYANDGYGQVKSVTSPSGEKIEYTYDGQERLRTVKDNAGNTTTYILDGNGNVTDLSLLAGSTTYNKTTFTYDRNDNLTSEKDALNNVTQFAYDEDGRLSKKTNPTGSSVSSAYDYYGNLSSIALSNGPTYGFGYDLEGQRTSATVTNGSLTNQFSYVYDEVGNLTTYTEKDGSGTTITQVSQPTGGLMYSAIDQLLGFDLKYKTYAPITYTFTYSPSGLVTKVKADGKEFAFDYDEGDNLIGRWNPNETKDTYVYDDANRLIGTQTDDVVTTVYGADKTIVQLMPLFSSKYSYDSEGRISGVTGTGPGSYTATYTYNDTDEKLNRLSKAQMTVGSIPYTFDYTNDPAGNILSMSLPNGDETQTQTFSYDADNRITNSGFSYDANGNLTQAVVKGITYKYVFDSANRLTEVKDAADNTIVKYTYDGDGLRLIKTVGTNPGVTTNYHYFQGQLLYETVSTDPADKIHALYLRSPVGELQGVRLYDNISGTYKDYYYHFNAHGDVVAVTDSTGAVYRQYYYDPYGNVIKVQNGSGQTVDINNDSGFNHAYTYAGYRYDQETGLYYLNARYYAAGIGRFLTKDTFVGTAAYPPSANRYAYTNGDPTNFIDPDGHKEIATAGAGGGYVVPGGGIPRPFWTKAPRQQGSYTIEFESGMKYHGKGPESRAQQSAAEKSVRYNDKAKSIDWTPSKNERQALIDEYMRLKNDGGPLNKKNYNKIESPGKKYYYKDKS